MSKAKTYRLQDKQASQLRYDMFELWAENRHVSDKVLGHAVDLVLGDTADFELVRLPAQTKITFFPDSQAVSRTAKSRARRGQSPRRYFANTPDGRQCSFTDEGDDGIKVVVRQLDQTLARAERRSTGTRGVRVC